MGRDATIVNNEKSAKDKEEELRIEALRLASAYSPNCASEDVVEVAESYYNFLKAKGTPQNG